MNEKRLKIFEDMAQKLWDEQESQKARAMDALIVEVRDLQHQLAELRGMPRFERLPDALEQENAALIQLVTDIANAFMGVYDDGMYYFPTHCAGDSDLENRVNRALGMEAGKEEPNET
jgi:hypothetical protein